MANVDMKLNTKSSWETSQKYKDHRDYYKQLHANKMDNLEERDKFLEKSSKTKPRWNEKINRPFTTTEIETVIEKLPTNRSPGPNGFTGKFYQTFREELTLILLKLF